MKGNVFGEFFKKLQQRSGEAKNQPRLIFSINSGRSGSEYLQRVLATGKNVSSFHEPEPYMSGEFLTMVMDQTLAGTTGKRRVKAKAIKKALTEMPADHIYAETNHMFIKTFYDVVMDSFPHRSIDVIILRRSLTKVLKSFASLGYFSEHNLEASRWMHRVPSGISLIQPPLPYEQMDLYDRSISYLIDIEAHAQAFKRDYPECQVHEVFLEQLQDITGVRDLFQRLKIEPTEQTEQIVSVRVNDRQGRKDELKIETSESYCHERLTNYLKLCRERGIQLPPLPQFQERPTA